MPDLFDSFVPEVAPPSGPALRTTRLLLRPLAAADAPAFHRLINDWEICRRLPDAPFPYPAQLATDWIEAAEHDRAAKRAEQFALVEAASGTLIGVAGLRMPKGQKTAELGYWLGRAHWNQGFALEAARRLVDWAFAALPIGQLTATVAADNDVSVALLHRLGFVQSGKGAKEFSCRPGQKMPVKHFALARDVPDAAGAATGRVVLVVAVALIDAQSRVLLARRPEGKKMAGLWEFPGGKMEQGETPEAALARELREELGIEVLPRDLAPFVFASHAYDGFHLLMPVFLCRRWKGEPHAREGQKLAWVAPADLVEYPMPPADRPLIPMLRDFL
jgi:8-oxo-dGTP diphosphatase